jgi:hypothetical protein
MKNKKDYLLLANIDSLSEMTEFIYKKVFRIDFNEPGFVVIDFGSSITSKDLRECMIRLKNNLSQSIKCNSLIGIINLIINLIKIKTLNDINDIDTSVN